jgi:hypothetical protein
MRPGPWFAACAVAVGVSGSALAQETPASEVAPATEWYPPPPPTGVYRSFSLTVAAGPGAMIGPGEQDLALSHNLLRFGWGLARNLTFYASLEGIRAPSVNPRTHARSWLRQDTVSLGIQRHFLDDLYVRGSLGAGFVGEDTANDSFSGGTGVALSGAVGREVIRLERTAVALELAGNITRYPTEYWGSLGLNLALVLF